MKTIEERTNEREALKEKYDSEQLNKLARESATDYTNEEEESPHGALGWDTVYASHCAGFRYGYSQGREDQKAIDDKRIKLLEEHLSAFKAFCENIINGMYVSVKDAAKEQLQYIKALEEEK